MTIIAVDSSNAAYKINMISVIGRTSGKYFTRTMELGFIVSFVGAYDSNVAHCTFL